MTPRTNDLGVDIPHAGEAADLLDRRVQHFADWVNRGKELSIRARWHGGRDQSTRTSRLAARPSPLGLPSSQ